MSEAQMERLTGEINENERKINRLVRFVIYSVLINIAVTAYIGWRVYHGVNMILG